MNRKLGVMKLLKNFISAIRRNKQTILESQTLIDTHFPSLWSDFAQDIIKEESHLIVVELHLNHLLHQS